MKVLKQAFVSHRFAARRRGIGFELSFEQWLKIWVDSGRLDERGRGRGKYVMARYGDKGPYAVGNVHITLYEQNCREYQVSEETKRRISKANKGNKHSLGHQNSLGYRHTPEARQKMSIAQFLRHKRKREQDPNSGSWTDGTGWAAVDISAKKGSERR